MTEHRTSDCHENKKIKCRHLLHLYEFSFPGRHGIPKASGTCHLTPPCLWQNIVISAVPLRKQRNNKDDLSPKVGAFPLSLFSQFLSRQHHTPLLLHNHQVHRNLSSQTFITKTMEEYLTHAISLMFSWKNGKLILYWVSHSQTTVNNFPWLTSTWKIATVTPEPASQQD